MRSERIRTMTRNQLQKRRLKFRTRCLQKKIEPYLWKRAGLGKLSGDGKSKGMGSFMSTGNKCKCGNQFLFVTQRLCNHSAFNGYRYTPSDYSAVRCAKCGMYFRTKSAYVSGLPDAPENWFRMSEAELVQWLISLGKIKS